MAFSTAVNLGLTTTETLTGDDLVANSQLLHSGYDVATTLDSTTTPDVTKVAYDTVALSAGSGTLDLTALSLNDVAVTLSGLKPRAIRFKNTGAAAITIAKGASSGYTGLGSAFSYTLQAGQSVQFYLGTAGTAVSGSVKIFDLTGTGTDTLQYSMAAGT